ncbi:MAG: aminotransferase class IV [Ferruginibacter sp.]
MNYYNYNGKILSESTAVIGANSRALRYGDGVFETIKLNNHRLILSDEHFSRLWKGMQLLQFDIPKLFTPEKIISEILKICAKNGHTTARIRLGIFRGDGGLYDSKNNFPNVIIQSSPLAENNGKLNSNGLQLCIFREAQKNCDAFSNLKHNNYLPYFMGALAAKKLQLNDAVILNNHQRICDSTIANIFMVKDEIIYTPKLEEGCVAGVIRKFLIQQLPSLGYQVYETIITEELLLTADEIFLTNSIYNIRWVAELESKSYSNKLTQKIVEKLQQTNPEVFC